MSTTNAAPADLTVMLDELGLSVSALRWRELLGSPEYSDFTPEQLLREVIETQYIETMNNRYKTNLRLSRLIDKSAIAENLVTNGKRRYNDDVVRQLLTFRFVEDRLNVGVYGVTEAGKSYFMSAFCNEACRRNYRCMYVDYCDLLDELLVLSRREDLDRYRKRLKYYSRIQLLFIDDFAISRYSEDGIKILYPLPIESLVILVFVAQVFVATTEKKVAEAVRELPVEEKPKKD